MSDEYSAEMAHAAAARGARWLDEKCPDWPERINTDDLDLANSACCVLGQTATCLLGPDTAADDEYHSTGYWRVFNAEHWTRGGGPQSDLGFDVPPGTTFEENDVRYEMLTIAWLEVIRERLAVPA